MSDGKKDEKSAEERKEAHKEANKKAKAAAATKASNDRAAEKKSREDSKPVDPVSPRLKDKYRNEIALKLMADNKYKSIMQVPKMEKIIINAGLGSKATVNIKVIDQALKDIAAISGQKPVSTKSKVAISNFKLRAGLPIGVMVTLRGDQMYEFMDRLISLALPRIRDFRGISDKGFDGRGNYTLGLKEQLVFPEVQYDTADSSFGMNITFVTSATTDDEGRALLNGFGFPFRKRTQQQPKAA